VVTFSLDTAAVAAGVPSPCCFDGQSAPLSCTGEEKYGSEMRAQAFAVRKACRRRRRWHSSVSCLICTHEGARGRRGEEGVGRRRNTGKAVGKRHSNYTESKMWVLTTT